MHYNKKSITSFFFFLFSFCSCLFSDPFNCEDEYSVFIKKYQIETMNDPGAMKFLSHYVVAKEIDTNGAKTPLFEAGEQKILLSLLKSENENFEIKKSDWIDSDYKFKYLLGFIEIVKFNSSTVWIEMNKEKTRYNFQSNLIFRLGPYNEGLRDFLVDFITSQQFLYLEKLYGKEPRNWTVLPSDLTLILNALSKCPQNELSKKCILAAGFFQIVINGWSEAQFNLYCENILEPLGLLEQFKLHYVIPFQKLTHFEK